MYNGNQITNNLINLKKIMNLKLKAISLIVLILLFFTGPIYSQGLFNNNSTNTTQGGATTGRGGILRDPPPGGSGDQPPGEVADDSPVGGGLAILSLLSVGFILLKRRNSEKE